MRPREIEASGVKTQEGQGSGSREDEAVGEVDDGNRKTAYFRPRETTSVPRRSSWEPEVTVSAASEDLGPGGRLQAGLRFLSASEVQKAKYKARNKYIKNVGTTGFAVDSRAMAAIVVGAKAALFIWKFNEGGQHSEKSHQKSPAVSVSYSVRKMLGVTPAKQGSSVRRMLNLGSVTRSRSYSARSQ